MEASISLKSIGKKITDKTLLAELSFGLQGGSRLAIVGPNNCGKSSIIKLLSGIIYKDKGQLYMKGRDISIEPESVKKITGYMSQKIDFNFNLSLLDNICFYAELFGLSNKEAVGRANNLCERFLISPYKYKKVGEIPRNIARIAMFIRAVIHDPEIILLDEPTLNLDVKYKKLLWDYMIKNSKEKTIIFSTQNLEEAKIYSNRIAIVYNAVIKFIGTYEDLSNVPYPDFSLEKYLLNLEREYID